MEFVRFVSRTIFLVTSIIVGLSFIVSSNCVPSSHWVRTGERKRTVSNHGPKGHCGNIEVSTLERDPTL